MRALDAGYGRLKGSEIKQRMKKRLDQIEKRNQANKSLRSTYRLKEDKKIQEENYKPYGEGNSDDRMLGVEEDGDLQEKEKN